MVSKTKKVKCPKEEKEKEQKYTLAFHAECKNKNREKYDDRVSIEKLALLHPMHSYHLKGQLNRRPRLHRKRLGWASFSAIFADDIYVSHFFGHCIVHIIQEMGRIQM